MTRLLRWTVAGLLRALALALAWGSLSGWNTDYVVYGLISVGLAVPLSLALLPPRQPRPATWPRRTRAALSLVFWFLWQSARGGVDVALRALTPTPDIDPVVVPASLDLPEGSARQIALILMNLMPGSMVQRLVTADGTTADHPDAHADRVELHTLSAALEPAEQWASLQRRVDRAFGC